MIKLILPLLISANSYAVGTCGNLYSKHHRIVSYHEIVSESDIRSYELKVLLEALEFHSNIRIKVLEQEIYPRIYRMLKDRETDEVILKYLGKIKHT